MGIYLTRCASIVWLVSGVLSSPGCGATSGRSAKDFFTDPQVVLLAEAVGKGDLKEIDRLISSGVDVDSLGTEGSHKVSLLEWAMAARKKDSFKCLLQHGADPNIHLGRPTSVTHGAARFAGDSEWLELVLQHKGNPNLTISSNKEETPIYNAIRSRDKKRLDLLIEAGADLNHQDDTGNTPLMFSAGRNWYDTTYYLLVAGADHTMNDNYGYDLACTVIDTSVDPNSELGRWRQKVIEFLKKKGVDFDAARAKRKRLDNRPPLKMGDLK